MWRDVEAGLSVAEAGASTPELAAELEMARALRALGGSIEAPAAVGAWGSLQSRIDQTIQGGGSVRRLHRPKPTSVARATLAVAAAFALLVAASLHAEPSSPLYGLRRGAEQMALALSPSDATLHLRLAGARLGDLVHTLSVGDYPRTAAAADSLASERDTALAGGADVTNLDALIRSEVPPALVGAPAEAVRAVDEALAGVLPKAANGTASDSDGHQHGGATAGHGSGSDQGGTDSSQGDGTTGSGDQSGSGGSSGLGDSQGSGGSSGLGDSQGSGGSSGSGDSQGSGGSGSGDQSGSDGGSGSPTQSASNQG
jgi:hypothetical protein